MAACLLIIPTWQANLPLGWALVYLSVYLSLWVWQYQLE